MSTPLPVVAHISRIVTRSADLITGDRSDYPLLVAGACSRALGLYGIESHVLYGHAAWIEVLENNLVVWAQSSEEAPHFWVQSEFNETIDLNMSVAFRRKIREELPSKSVMSPPLLWSKEVPSFYHFHIEGAAELAPESERDRRWWKRLLEEVEKQCKDATLEVLGRTEPDFPNEPMICTGRKLLDDSKETFKHFDRAISVMGLPNAPF